MLRWMVPVDNTTTRTIGWRFFAPHLDPRGQDDPARVGKETIDFVGQTADERSYAERQRQPGDFEAQVSQRPIAIHALEHRATSDAGVARLRRLLRNNVRALAAGDPVVYPGDCGMRTVPTYCQDTVSEWRYDTPPDDDALRAHGRHIADAVLGSSHLLPAAREARVRDACDDLS